ncbi:MAG: cold-shock protein [Hyphomonadaceae bacterium]
MPIGTVTSFDRRKGVGIVTPADGSDEISLHVSEVERSGLSRVEVGDHIYFERRVHAGRHTVFAVNISLIASSRTKP